MFVEAEHEQVCPCRYRRYVLAKGSDLEATSAWCIAATRYSMYAISKCLMLGNWLWISACQTLLWFESWGILKYSLLSSCWLSASISRFGSKKREREGPPFPKFVLFLQRHWIGYGRECKNNCQGIYVLNPERGANDFVAYIYIYIFGTPYDDQTMKPCSSW